MARFQRVCQIFCFLQTWFSIDVVICSDMFFKQNALYRGKLHYHHFSWGETEEGKIKYMPVITQQRQDRNLVFPNIVFLTYCMYLGPKFLLE